MDIRSLALDDPRESKVWYAAYRDGASAGRRAPIVESYDALLASLRDNGANPSTDRRAFGAWDGSACVGVLLMKMPRRTSTHIAELDVYVSPQARRRGVGKLLFDFAETVARKHDRTLICAEIDVPADQSLETAAGGRFALARGFVSKHTEARLLLDLPMDPTTMRDADRHAAAKASDHHTVGWTGLPPQEHLEAFAALHTLMEQEAVEGTDPVVYDADLVTAAYARLLKQGFGLVTTMVLDPDGAPAAYTTLFVTDTDVILENTFVRPDRPGHGLSTLVEAANLRLLAEHHPEARHVHTWTAGIGERLGFRVVETLHTVELELAPLT